MIRIEQQIPTEQYGFIKITVEESTKKKALKDLNDLREEIAPIVREERGEAVKTSKKSSSKTTSKKQDDDF